MSESKSNAAVRRSICSAGINLTFDCNYDAAIAELRKIYSDQATKDGRNDESCDPDDSPSVVVVRIAFHLVYKAFLTGNSAEIEPACVEQLFISKWFIQYSHFLCFFFHSPSLCFFFFPFSLSFRTKIKIKTPRSRQRSVHYRRPAC